MKRADSKKEITIATKFGEFLCIFESNTPDSGFTVTSPATPGFVMGGRTLREARRMAREGIEFHCECELFERVPAPRSLKKSATR